MSNVLSDAEVELVLLALSELEKRLHAGLAELTTLGVPERYRETLRVDSNRAEFLRNMFTDELEERQVRARPMLIKDIDPELERLLREEEEGRDE